MSQNSLSFTLRLIIGVAALGLAVFFVNLAAGFIVPLLLAWIIVLSASPLFYWLREKKVSGGIAFILTFLAILAVLGFLAVTLIIAVNRLADLLPTYTEEIDAFKQSVEDLLTGLGLGQVNSSDAAQLIDPGTLMGIYASLIAGAAEAFSDIILVFMAIIFMLVELFNMPAKVAAELEVGNDYLRRIQDFSIEIRRYVSITTWIGLVTGVIDTIFFVIMGVPLPLLWGLLAFLLSYIPVIGFWLAAIPPTLLAYLESGPLAALIVFAGIVIINGAADEILKPKIMGEGLDLAPIMVVFSVMIWSAILGPLGAILGVPVTMVVKELVLEADEKNRWIAHLMGKGSRLASLPDKSEEEPPASVP